MKIKKHLPNLLTLSNLFCGILAILFVLESRFEMVAALVILGILFDFLDGFAARLLKVQSELGKQLDSLADMVTSGVVPGLVMYQLLKNTADGNVVGDFTTNFQWQDLIPYAGFLLTLGACYRLANFNIDTRQSETFIGLPTPAMSLMVISLPLVAYLEPEHFAVPLLSNTYFLGVLTLVLTYIMNAEIELFSLKFKNTSWADNKVKYLFLFGAISLIIGVSLLAIPLIILWYVLLSVGVNRSGAVKS